MPEIHQPLATGLTAFFFFSSFPRLISVSAFHCNFSVQSSLDLSCRIPDAASPSRPRSRRRCPPQQLSCAWLQPGTSSVVAAMAVVNGSFVLLFPSRFKQVVSFAIQYDFVISFTMFAVLVRFQELTSYLSPVSGYFGQIDGGENAVMCSLLFPSIMNSTSFLFQLTLI